MDTHQFSSHCIAWLEENANALTHSCKHNESKCGHVGLQLSRWRRCWQGLKDQKMPKMMTNDTLMLHAMVSNLLPVHQGREASKPLFNGSYISQSMPLRIYILPLCVPDLRLPLPTSQ